MERMVAVAVILAALVVVAWTFTRTDNDGTTQTAESAEVTPAPITPGAAPTPAPTPEDLGAAPDLVDIEAWLNTGATGFEAARGPVTIVQFWTFGCFNCKNTLPHLQEIYARHHDRGLAIVGVHTPEFDYEADIENVRTATVDLGVTWPVAIDNTKTNFRTWQTGGKRYWPRTYVVDANGRIRFDHIGEGAYDDLEATVVSLLGSGAG